MAAPTLISTVQIDSPWTQSQASMAGGVATKNYASTLSTQAGDLIVTLQGSADSASTDALTVADGVNTYTSRTSSATSSHCPVQIATAPDSSGGTRTLTLTRATTAPATNSVGGVAHLFRGHGGVGNVYTAADGIQTGNLTCSANSAILVICLDWNAVAGAHSWATINGNAPTATYGVTGDATTWAAAVAYWADVGAAGSKTITLSSPTFTAATFAAIEILAGAASGPTITADPVSQAFEASGGTASFTCSATGTGTLHYQWKKNGSNVGTDSATYAPTVTSSDADQPVYCAVTDDNGTTNTATAYIWIIRRSIAPVASLVMSR